jgi:hypothetical protein
MFTKAFKVTTLAASLACMGMGLTSTAVLAGGDNDDDGFKTVVNVDMKRRAPGSTSGSGHTVEANCPVDPSGNAWQDATATLRIEQEGDQSVARVKVKDAVPNTVFTVWMRMAGSSPGDETGANNVIGPNPMNGGGATPLLPGSALDVALSQSPPNAGTATPTNGFTTDKKGNATFTIGLDFPVIGGAYPFHRASDAAVTDLRIAGSTWPLVRTPAAIVNPNDTGIGGPFLLRVISHCTDGLGHGLSPAVREAWFEW